eukprot:5652697-Ditylum_brightwellii.AAC.1
MKAQGKSKHQEQSSTVAHERGHISKAVSAPCVAWFYLLERSDCKDMLLVSSQHPIHGMPVEDSMEGLVQDD